MGKNGKKGREKMGKNKKQIKNKKETMFSWLIFCFILKIKRFTTKSIGKDKEGCKLY